MSRDGSNDFQNSVGAGENTLGLRTPSRQPLPNAIDEDRINEVTGHAQYRVFPGTTTTVCCITLRNGYTVVGKSACVDPRNFNEVVGRKLAYNAAKASIGELEGYLLQERRYGGDL